MVTRFGADSGAEHLGDAVEDERSTVEADRRVRVDRREGDDRDLSRKMHVDSPSYPTSCGFDRIHPFTTKAPRP